MIQAAKGTNGRTLYYDIKRKVTTYTVQLEGCQP